MPYANHSTNPTCPRCGQVLTLTSDGTYQCTCVKHLYVPFKPIVMELPPDRTIEKLTKMQKELDAITLKLEKSGLSNDVINPLRYAVVHIQEAIDEIEDGE